VAKRITCRHAGVVEQIMGRPVQCDWAGSAPKEAEIIDALVEHNRIAHGVASRDAEPLVVERVRGLIEDAEGEDEG
jgi:predicted small metal-binding protein